MSQPVAEYRVSLIRICWFLVSVQTKCFISHDDAVQNYIWARSHPSVEESCLKRKFPYFRLAENSIATIFSIRPNADFNKFRIWINHCYRNLVPFIEIFNLWNQMSADAKSGKYGIMRESLVSPTSRRGPPRKAPVHWRAEDTRTHFPESQA